MYPSPSGQKTWGLYPSSKLGQICRDSDAEVLKCENQWHCQVLLVSYSSLEYSIHLARWEHSSFSLQRTLNQRQRLHPSHQVSLPQTHAQHGRRSPPINYKNWSPKRDSRAKVIFPTKGHQDERSLNREEDEVACWRYKQRSHSVQMLALQDDNNPKRDRAHILTAA